MKFSWRGIIWEALEDAKKYPRDFEVKTRNGLEKACAFAIWQRMVAGYDSTPDDFLAYKYHAGYDPTDETDMLLLEQKAEECVSLYYRDCGLYM